MQSYVQNSVSSACLSKAIVSVAIALLASAPAEAGELVGRVISVSDGDTIRVVHDDIVESVRLAGVDCPERSQEFGEQATRVTTARCLRKMVRVTYSRKDRYGRLIGEVFLRDGHVLNEDLLRTGCAWWYQRYAPRDLRLEELEARARIRRVGLWAESCPTPPWAFRKAKRGKSSEPNQRIAIAPAK